MEQFLEYYICTAVFVFGAIIGSFLNVVIYRFHTGKSLNGDSHCLSCLEPLRWFELFPLVSYLCLRGKCRTCASYIPPRYFVVELATALGFLGIYSLGSSFITMFFLGIVLAVLIVIAVYDLYHFVIPNELVLLLGVIAVAESGYRLYEGMAYTALLNPVLSALGAFMFFASLWKFSKGRWIGFGDAKLAVPLGFMAGFPAVFSLVVLSFWIGAVLSIVLLGLQQLSHRGKLSLQFYGAELTMKSEIPFAPFLILGFILSTIYRIDVLTIIAYVF